MTGLVVDLDDPRADDVRSLLAAHLTFARSETPPEDAHALDLDGLLEPAVTFVSARRDGELMAIGALRELDPEHGELKSMHTSHIARRQGAGSALLTYLIDMARNRAYRRLSLETGSHPMFAPARSLYERAGFVPAGPFGEYQDSPNSTYMTLDLTSASAGH